MKALFLGCVLCLMMGSCSGGDDKKDIIDSIPQEMKTDVPTSMADVPDILSDKVVLSDVPTGDVQPQTDIPSAQDLAAEVRSEDLFESLAE